MSHQVCHDISEWVENNVSQPVERCVERDCNWWCLCCNKWFCFIVWVVVTVGSWVVHAVCEVVADVIDVVVGIVTGVWDILAGIFTWNWARVWDGLLKIVVPIIVLAVDLFRIITGGDLVGFFVDSADAWRLRNYVRGLVEGNRRYTDEERGRIKDALGLDAGGFGLRLKATAYRGYVRSDARPAEGGVPDLVSWNNDPNDATKVDLKILAGINWTGFWQRSRPDLVGDSGSVSESDLDDYLASPDAANVKHFSIYCMTEAVLTDKLKTAVIKAEEVGLKLQFDTQDVQLTRASQVRVVADDAPVVTMLTSSPFNRAAESVDAAAAKRDLCTPIVVGTFLFTDNGFRGYSAHLHPSACFPDTNGTTGTVFRDNVPDIVWRYVPVHELGHTFGLCHVDGIDHIMYGPKDKHWYDWTFIPEYFWLGGEPSFTFDEAKAVWDYIIANFSVECLATRQF